MALLVHEKRQKQNGIIRCNLGLRKPKLFQIKIHLPLSHRENPGKSPLEKMKQRPQRILENSHFLSKFGSDKK